MATTAYTWGPPQDDREVTLVASAVDRLEAFRKAQRHTLLVRSLRLVLPIAACLALVAYSSLVVTVVGFRPKGFDPGTMRIDTDNLTMENPKYDGFGKDGTRYQLRAKSAVTDLKMAGPVRLSSIEGDFIQQNGVPTKLTAGWGQFDQKNNVLELFDPIHIDSPNGTKARLTRATVYTKENRVVSKEPVTAETPTATVRAQTMILNSKSRQVRFEGAVNVQLRPTSPARPGVAQSAKASPLTGFNLNTGAPVEVVSETLDIDDNAHTALFRQNVVARQGESTLTAPELEAIYEGRVGAVAGSAPESADASTKLKTMLARGGVAMNQKADRATSDTLEYDAAKDLAILRGHVVLASANERRATSAVAEFDRRTDTILLKGDVVVTQGKNVMKGERLFSDRKSGKTRLESPAEGGQPAGRVAATFYRPDPKPGETAKGRAAGGSPGAVPGATLLGNSFRTDPSAPIDVGADTLDIVDQTRQAVFRGNVVANQGGFVLRAVEVTALYSGQPGIGFDAAAGGKADAGQGAQLTKIEARQKVIVSSADGRTATGDWADLNVKANTAVIGGKVIVSEGKSVVEGTRLFIDMNTGQSRFENADGQAAAQSSATCPPGGVCPKGRIRAVFYPKEVEGAAKKGEAKRAEQQLGAPQGSPAPKQPAASSWRATTRGPGAE